MPAERIGDHRRAYLDYEGPSGGGRGKVSQADAGALGWQVQDLRRFEFVLKGLRLSGTFVLSDTGGGWILSGVHPQPGGT